MSQETKEPQYKVCLDIRDREGMTQLGLMSNQYWHDDPKRLAFVLSRYKFVAKMLGGKKRVLEVGCGDGFASRIVRQEVGHLTALDFDPVFIDDAGKQNTHRWGISFGVHDILQSPVDGSFDAAYSLDVLEHILPSDEQLYMEHITAAITDHGVMIVGSPSLESQAYASDVSKVGHVNCKKAPELKALMERYFYNVFVFSMNDEVIHTGHSAMAHYLIAVGCTKK